MNCLFIRLCILAQRLAPFSDRTCANLNLFNGLVLEQKEQNVGGLLKRFLLSVKTILVWLNGEIATGVMVSWLMHFFFRKHLCTTLVFDR